MQKIFLIVSGVALMALWGAADAATQAEQDAVQAEEQVERKGPLAALPSKPGPHMAKIEALGDGESLILESPAPDPKWGSARGRGWGMYALIHAPELGGAFFFGEGPHGHIKPDGYAMDDLWFLDFNANRWMCLHPGTHPATFSQDVASGKLKADKFGRLVDPDGQPIPVHTHIHAWGFLSYDTHRQEFAFWALRGPEIITYFLGGREKMAAGLKQLAEQGLAKKRGGWSPWFYEARTGRFDLRPAKGSSGISYWGGGGFPQFHYVPARKLYYAMNGGQVATFDPATNTWTPLKVKGKGTGGSDVPGCLDTKRLRIYHGADIYYDIEANAWVRPNAQGTKPSPMSTVSGGYYYDERNDAVIVFQHAYAKKQPGTFVYDPESNTWTRLGPLPKGIGGHHVYDAVNNVFWSFEARDGSLKPGRLAAWRYKVSEPTENVMENAESRKEKQ
jgi:hypothetical protein